jgi:hypothetical protein
MPAGPSKALEAIAALFVPPACREEVLGDLHEKYSSPAQYFALALRTVPFVIVSRIRRTNDGLALLTEALLLYGSYLAAAWYTDRALLAGQWAPLRPAMPAAIAVCFFAVEHAWRRTPERSPRQIALSVTRGTGFAFLCMTTTLPLALNLWGSSVGLLLVSAARMLMHRGMDLRHAAPGPAMGSEPAVLPRIRRTLVAEGIAIAVTAVGAAALGIKPAIVEAVIVIVIVFELSRFRKE